jgi:SSS family solute:Na+ symporter
MISTIVVVLVIYFVAMIGIGWVGRGRTQNFESYLNMGRSGGIILLTGGAIGGQVGNGFVVGGAAEGAAFGMAGAAYGIACALGSIMVAIFLNDFIYKGNYMSLAGYTLKRYNNAIPGAIYDLSTAISSIGLIAGQIMAGKALFEALGMPGVVGAIAISVVVLLYSQMAGLWGAFATSVVQTCVILAGLVVTTIILLSKGAIGDMNAAIAAGSLAPSALNFEGMTAAGFAGMMIPLLLGMVTDQPTYQRINSAKSAKASKIACYLSFLVMIPLALMPAFIGSYGAFEHGVSGGSAFFVVVMNELPAIACALIIAAVIAAVMSTIDCGLITMSTVLTRDIWQGALKKNPSEAQLKKITLGVNIAFMGVSTILALMSSSILGLLNSVYSFLAAACFVPFVGGVLWKTGNAQGAVAASIVGVGTVLVSWAGVSFPVPVIFPIIPSAIAYVVVSLATQNPEAKAA